jgi:S1-C subfamily serine protease
MYESHDTLTTETPARPPTRRLARVLGSLVMAVALFASGVGIGWLVSSEPANSDDSAAAIITNTGATTSTTAQAAGDNSVAPPSVYSAEPPVATAPQIAQGEEPVADIAEAVLPSMVQIELLDQTGAQLGVGSGVIYDPDGYILTAAHVVEGANIVRVKLNDGTVLDATVVGSDTTNDIAVVQVQRDGLEAAALALGEELRAGQLAIAVGSPWGLDSTVTAGIVSAVNRPLLANTGSFFVNMIQTDASINPGNSGGALVNRDGKIIGINVSIYSTSGANDGVGFAVPIDRAFRVATALTDGGTFVPGLLGVRGSAAGVNETPGAVISEVTPGSAADDAGIRIGDVIVALNGQDVTGIEDLSALVRSYQAGETVVVDVIRGGEQVQLGVTLGAAG